MIGEERRQFFQRVFIVAVIELRHNQAAIGDIKIDVRPGQPFAFWAQKCCIHHIQPARLFGCHRHRRRLMNLMNLQWTSAGICRCLENVQGFGGARVLRVGFVIRPGQGHCAWPNKAAQVIDMPVGFVLINAARQPDDFFDAQIILHRLFDVTAR